MAKILIVEDESIVAWDIKETLEKLGHNVVDLAISGAEALQAAAREHPDLVLMDIRLEGEMDGITAGDEIYHQLEIPIVYLTAHADELTLARATKTDPFGYIVKPFQSQTLQSTIKVALQRHQLEASASLAQSHLTNTLNSIGSGIIITDRQGLVTFINPIAEQLTGWQSIEAIGIEIDRVFHLIWETDGTPIENPSVRAMRLKQTIKSPARCWLMSKDNLEIPIADTATPIYKPDGRVVGSIIVFHDNTEHVTAQMDLWERNQDLEFFQSNFITQLEEQTGEYQQAIACMQVLDSILKKIHTAKSESELLQIAIQQLGIALEADYGWVALHDCQNATATIVCEYIDRERQISPTSKIGKQIDVLLYPKFYNHLFESASWVDPPREIIPSIYLNLAAPTDGLLILPIVTDLQASADLAAQWQNWTIGEIGIITTGKPTWAASQAQLITQTFSYAVRLFRQIQRKSVDLESIALSLEWLNSLQDEFSSSIALVNRDLTTSAQMLKQQIDSIVDLEIDNLAVVRHHQNLHQELAANSHILQAEWQRQFQLIDTLIDIQTNGITFQVQSLSDIQFSKWIGELVESCSNLAKTYQQEIGYQITEQLPSILLYPFPILEIIILEMVNNACKYTPSSHLIMLEVDVRDDRFQLRIVSVGIEIPARELELIFLPFAIDSHGLSSQHGIAGLGWALVKRLIPLLGGKIETHRDRDATSLLLTVPLGSDFPNHRP